MHANAAALAALILHSYAVLLQAYLCQEKLAANVIVVIMRCCFKPGISPSIISKVHLVESFTRSINR